MSKNTGTSELINYFDLGANGDVGIAGSLDVNTIANATTDTDKFLVSDTGIIKYRTGAELLSDIGAAPAVAGGYVPYTGATTNVDLGIYNITAHTIRATGSANNAGQINLRSDAIFSLVNGYGTIGSGTTNQFNFYQTTGAGVFRGAIFSLNSITASATRTFTLPDADGTIALTSSLSGYLPLTGGTLTGPLNGTSATFSGLITGQTNSAGNITQNFLAYNSGSSISGASYDFQSGGTSQTARISANYEASSPDRMAMRFLVGQGSGLVEILKLFNSTMTVTGAATFSSSVTANGDVFINNASNAQIGFNTTGALNSVGAYLYFNRSSVNKWTAGMGPYTGSNNFEIVTGSVVALSLAVTTGAATFTGDLIINSLNPITYCNATSNNRASGIVTQESGTSKWAFGTNFGTSDNSWNVYNYTAGARYLTIASTGAATFSSSVTASGTGTFGSTNYLTNISTGSGATYQRILNTGGDVIFGINNSTGGSLLPGAAGYATVLYNNTNTDISFGTNQVERMRITSTGYVWINGSISGMSGSSANLQINGFARIGGQIILHNSANAAQAVSISCNGADSFNIAGALSKNSGSFRIDHPLLSKKDTHHLVHSFIEGPQADNIYRGKIQLVNGKAIINLDQASKMTEGTFVLLNGNVQCFTSNEGGWTAIKGRIDSNILIIESEDSECTDTVSWLVVGERHDQHMIDTDWTDENGKVIVEPLKKINK